MKLIAFITGAGVARQILEHLELPTTGPPTAKAVQMGDDEREPAPEYDQVDPTATISAGQRPASTGSFRTRPCTHCQVRLTG